VRQPTPPAVRDHWHGMLFSEALAELFEFYGMEEVRLPENRLHTIYWVHKPKQPEPLTIRPVEEEKQK